MRARRHRREGLALIKSPVEREALGLHLSSEQPCDQSLGSSQLLARSSTFDLTK